jgi:hypothetical protein
MMHARTHARNPPGVGLLLSELEPGLGGPSLTSTEFADWTSCTVATKADVENHFNTHGTGEITEIKLMNGFGFIEYKDAMDARDVVPGTYFFPPLLPPHLADVSTEAVHVLSTISATLLTSS